MPQLTGPSADVSAIRVSGLYRTYDPDVAPVRALRGLDLQLAAGEFVALTGPSGCGKSTLLNLLAGLDQADGGTIQIAGVDINDLSEDQLARVRRTHIGMVFQFFHLVENMSALDNVALAGLVGGLRAKAARQRASELLDMLGLLDKAGTLPASLSGGQRQRLAIARALVNDPTVLLADEPTGALDSAGATEVVELLQRLHAEGQTILVVTHNEDVANGADRTVRLRDGKVVPDGAASEVVQSVGPR